MNATDTHERVVEGFKELSALLREDTAADPKKVEDANQIARTAAQERVRAEYDAAGIAQPHEYALSITARRELGYPISKPEQEQVA
jgi:hypothetical protein